MSEPTAQQKANLARIRDNQRRSRARRKEYLQELETKYRSCEAVGAEASAEMQAVARKVLDENKRLRRLLRQQGFSDADIDGPGHDEFASSPTAAEMLGVMLLTRKPCRPSSGCGESSACNPDDDDESRRQSCASTPAAPIPIAPQQQQQQQQQHQPVALAPAPIPVAPRPQSHEPVSQQPLPRQSQHYLPLQPQQPTQYQSQPTHHQIPPQQQQQFYMTPPPQSAATPVPHPNSQPPTNALAHEYPIYAPQPYGYAAPPSQLLDWDMSSAGVMSQQTTYTSPSDHGLTYASPVSGYSARGSFTSPTPITMPAYTGQDNTSSCFVAADAIRTMHAGAGPEVETALGCRDAGDDCRVNNTVVFDVMDRYAGVQGQHTGM